MAQKVLVSMVDDITGHEATQTVIFALDGVTYEIDLSDDNAGALRDELASFVNAARRVGGRQARGTAGSATAPNRERTQAIRAWARDNGFAVSDRGRIPVEITSAYDTAQATPEAAPTSRKRATRKKPATA